MVYLVPRKKCEYFDTRPGNHVETDAEEYFLGYHLFRNAVLDYDLEEQLFFFFFFGNSSDDLACLRQY